MIGDDLLRAAAASLAGGQKSIAAEMKRLVAASGHPVAATLDYSDDATFLDPALFAYFMDPADGVTLDDVLGGSAPCFPSDVNVGAAGPRVVTTPHVDAAFQVLARVTPLLHECLTAVIRRVIVFASDEGDSFASPSAHGAVFLRPPPDADEVFFIEDLAHQGGHVMLTAITVDGDACFAMDSERSLADLTGEPDDGRTVYVAFHGLFTECLISIALHACLEAGVFKGRKRHEAAGRLSFAMRRLQLDLPALRQAGVMTEQGAAMVRSFGEVFDQVFARAGDLIAACDLSNQPYTFSYERFVERNDAAPASARA
ncbi:MAG: hypothetical protein HRU14_04670 [Planctomycetes bacterium]|nr:hypothetical protein [Planctomycetota bacterium]